MAAKYSSREAEAALRRMGCKSETDKIAPDIDKAIFWYEQSAKTKNYYANEAKKSIG